MGFEQDSGIYEESYFRALTLAVVWFMRRRMRSLESEDLEGGYCLCTGSRI